MSERRWAQSRLVPGLLAVCLSWLTALHTAPATAEAQGDRQDSHQERPDLRRQGGETVICDGRVDRREQDRENINDRGSLD